MRLEPAAFAAAPQKSIDYAVMEKTDRAAVVVGHFRWSDIGSWDAIFDIAERDKSGNAVHGAVVTTDTRNCVIHSVDRLTAVIGADDLVVVSTPDAVLVVPRARAQEVRELVGQAQERASAPRRPSTGAAIGRGAITIRSTAASDSRSSASWCVPAARCRCRSTTIAPSIGWWCAAPPRSPSAPRSSRCTRTSSIYIPIGAVHRLANRGKIPLELIEVQTGSYLGEDDIVRIEDEYKR